MEDERERATRAAEVMRKLVDAPENIPRDLLDDAHAIAVVPHVVKGAFIVGGQYGKGLVSHRDQEGNWSPPSYIDMSGASVGFQVGGQTTDYVLVFTNEEGFRPLLKGKVELGGEVSVAAGPVGRTAAAATDVTADAAVYTYSRSKGAFAGVSLKGAGLTIDDGANKKVYGQDVTGTEILLEEKVTVNSVVQPFTDALKQLSPPHQHVKRPEQ